MLRASVSLQFAASLALLNKGKVEKWIPHKGFGFILEEGTNKQIFVHNTALKMEANAFRALAQGQEVEYDLVKDGDREKATNVTAVGGALLPPGTPPPQQEYFGGRGGGRGGRGGFQGGRGGRGGYNNNNNNNNNNFGDQNY